MKAWERRCLASQQLLLAVMVVFSTFQLFTACNFCPMGCLKRRFLVALTYCNIAYIRGLAGALLRDCASGLACGPIDCLVLCRVKSGRVGEFRLVSFSDRHSRGAEGNE